MEYFVQLTSRTNGKIHFFDVEASSEEEAMGRFDPVASEIKVIPPDQIEQAKQAHYDQLQKELDIATNAIRQQYMLKGLVVWYLLAVVLAGALVAWVNSHFDRGETDLFRPKKSDTERALEFKVLTDD